MVDRPSGKRTDEPVRFIRASEIAARLGVARPTIYGWVEAGSGFSNLFISDVVSAGQPR